MFNEQVQAFRARFPTLMVCACLASAGCGLTSDPSEEHSAPSNIRPSPAQGRTSARRGTTTQLLLEPHVDLQPSGKLKLGTTFGVPLPPGFLAQSSNLRLTTAAGDEVPAEFTEVASWSHLPSVRWLRIDASVPALGGVVEPMMLEAGPGITPWAVPDPLTIVDIGSHLEVHTSAEDFLISKTEPLGVFRMVAGGQEYRCGDGNTPIAATIERAGPVYGLIKFEGRYINPNDPNDILGECHIRLRFYHASSEVRLYHTFVWYKQLAQVSTLEGLSFHYDGYNGTMSALRVGADGAQHGPYNQQTEFFQSKDQLTMNNAALGQALQWLEVDGNNGRQFLSVRWWAENYPSVVRFDPTTDRLVIGLIDNQGLSMGLDAPSMVAPELETAVWAGDNIPINTVGYHQSEFTGVAKTHEIIIRRHDGGFHLQNAQSLAQRPLIFSGDRSVTSGAHQPVPWSPPKTGSGVPSVNTELEGAIVRTLAWMQRRDDNFGTKPLGWVYHGAHHYSFNPRFSQYNNHRPDRYWGNHGNAFSGAPWVQWLRAQSRDLLDFAETNARYKMDLATYNAPFSVGGRELGTQAIYSALPWGRWNYGYGGHANEADYLVAYCYLLGYERACDAVEKRTFYHLNYDHLAKAPSANLRESTSRLLELLLLYRETGDNTLKNLADAYLARIQSMLTPDGKLDSGYAEAPFFVDANLAQAAHVARNFHDPAANQIWDLLAETARYNGIHGYLEGSTGALSGPKSLYPILARYWAGIDPYAVISKAVAPAQDQAQTLNRTTVDGWLGASASPQFWAGLHLREWFDVLAELENAPSGMTFDEAAPMAFVMPDRLGDGRHFAYALCTRGALTIKSFLRGFASTGVERLLVYDASGALVGVGTHADSPEGYPGNGRLATVTVNNCINGHAYGVEVQTVSISSHRTWVRLVSNQGKLVQHIAHDQALVSNPRGGTMWFAANASPIRLEVFLNDENRRMGKMVVVRNTSLKLMCTSRVVGTDATGGALQDPCEVANPTLFELYGVSVSSDTSEMQAESIVNFGALNTGLDPFGASTIGEYFELASAPHFSGLIPP